MARGRSHRADAIGTRRPVSAWIAAGGALLLLPGCAPVDRPSATAAFAGAAHATRDAFRAIDRDEQHAFLASALAQPPADLRLSPTRACLVEGTADAVPAALDCRVRLVVRGAPVDVDPAGPKLLLAADTLVRYADALAGAAQAKDLDARQEAMHRISASVGSLAALAGVPGVQALGNLLADVEHAREINRRRRALARVAEAVDPAVQALAALIGERAERLRANVVMARGQELLATESAFGLAPPGAGRQELARQALASADDVRAAAAAEVDFTALGRAHRAVMAALAHPRTDLSATLGTIDAFAEDALALAQAVGGEDRHGGK